MDLRGVGGYPNGGPEEPRTACCRTSDTSLARLRRLD